MNIKYTRGGQLYELKNVGTVWVELDNGNEVSMFEVDSGVLEITNTTEACKNCEMGLLITPQNYSTIHIIPEG